MLLQHFMEGGTTGMLLIITLWIVTLILTGYLGFRLAKKDQYDANKNKSISETIFFLGSFAFLFGIFYQIIGMIQALKAIEAAGDISMALIAGGLKVSLIAPMYGFVLFLLTYIIWFVTRRFNQ
jgi:hypothetical protein